MKLHRNEKQGKSTINKNFNTQKLTNRNRTHVHIQFLLTMTDTMASARVEAGSNTSTVNLRVVRGDEMGLKKAAP
jgi:hypothetical protein